MCEETLGLHTAFHANTIIPEKNFHWIRQTSHQMQGRVTASTVNPLISDNSNMFPFGSAFCGDQLNLHLASRLSLSDMQTRSTGLSEPNEYISSLAISPNGCVCVALTTRSNMLIYGADNLTVEHLTILLDYSMFTGATWEDIIMCQKPGYSYLLCYVTNIFCQSYMLDILRIGPFSKNAVKMKYGNDNIGLHIKDKILKVWDFSKSQCQIMLNSII